jgi:hypothetical protein
MLAAEELIIALQGLGHEVRGPYDKGTNPKDLILYRPLRDPHGPTLVTTYLVLQPYLEMKREDIPMALALHHARDPKDISPNALKEIQIWILQARLEGHIP